MNKSGLFKNAAVLTFGSFFAKCVGAVYKIVLVGLLGGYGMGVYQMAYPLFCLLLTLSSAGIPSALARMIARETAYGAEDGGTVRAALSSFALLGTCGALLMCALAPLMARLQGNASLLSCYFALAPSVFFCALIAVLRGYFQGKSRMEPTASSAIVEQLTKAATGIFFALRFAGDPARAVPAALLAVTLSEAAALFFLAARYRREPRPRLLSRRPRGNVLKEAFPVMAASALLPLSQAADSVLIVRLLRLHTERAVTLYGVFSGAVLSLVRLPATLSAGLAGAIVPAVASAGEGERKRRALLALFATLLLSLPCGAAFFFFADRIVSLLYPSLGADVATAATLLRLSAFSAVALACVDTLSASLTGLGRAGKAAWAMFGAVAVKTAAEILLVRDARYSIYGAAIAANACYSVAFFLDLIYTVKKEREVTHDHSCKSRRGTGRYDAARRAGGAGGGRGSREDRRDLSGADA